MHARFRVLCLALATAAVLIATSLATGASGDSGANYVILYKAQSVPSDAAKTIASAGGTLVYSYDQIGVAIARSSNASFRDDVMKDNRVDGASATTNFASKLPDEQASADSSTGDLPNAPASDSDSLSPLQWDMQQIHTPQAHAVTGGSPAVLAGDIDTGIDFNHPDLKQNIDVADSVNCLTGAPVPGTAAQDVDGHGTHTAGTIAAAANGIGVVGVAPNVKIAAIKSGNDEGFFFPEAVICGFVWAGTHHVDVTNNSYFADPYLFNCRNDPVQRAIWKAEKRAIQFAMDAGVTVVAAEGNESDDLSHPQVDLTSPDNTTPEQRDVTNACVVIPVEIPGVVGVTATGDRQQVDGDNDATDYLKSYYSSYGISTADVTGPGGDFYYGRSARSVNGLVLSTYPATSPCTRSVKEPTGDVTYPTAVYCYLQGTSMASPHVAGIAALIISRFGDLSNPKNGKMRPGAVAAQIQQTADPQPCPTELPLQGAPGSSRANVPYAATTRPSGDPQECQGGPGHNSWYGNGRADAFNAVMNISGSAANNEPSP
ncbi:MAG: peptidase S8 [Actinobacteria bacterium]|nr:MAG: peptidase S8 [Actinomycetota bacterium]